MEAIKRIAIEIDFLWNENNKRYANNKTKRLNELSFPFNRVKYSLGYKFGHSKTKTITGCMLHNM